MPPSVVSRPQYPPIAINGSLNSDAPSHAPAGRDDDGVAVLTLNRPQRLNSFNAAMHAELRHALNKVRDDAQVRCLLLTGAGKAFSAGGDFNWFPSFDDVAKLETLRRDAKQMIWDLLDVEIPVSVEAGPMPGSDSAEARTIATCEASRPAPSAICARQLVPSATMAVPGSASRAAGRRDNSPIAIDSA